MLQPPEEGEKSSAKQSPGKEGLSPLPDDQPGSGMGAEGGGLEATPSVLVRGILRC